MNKIIFSAVGVLYKAIGLYKSARFIYFYRPFIEDGHVHGQSAVCIIFIDKTYDIGQKFLPHTPAAAIGP